MKLPLSWIKEYVSLTLPVDELAHRITMAGTEVSSSERIGGDWHDVFVGQVVEVNPHPNADRLRLATVNIGKETQTVVCGAPNVAAGQKVAFARVGADLIDGHTGQKSKLKPAKIRGVLSEGMVCSEKELGISQEHAGIVELPADAPLGAPLSDYLGDVIWDLKVTPNRPDLLSVLGIARELAALTGQPLKLPPLDYSETPEPVTKLAAVEVLDADLCTRYCGGVVTGIKMGPSPQWMQKRLLAAGMRPINNIVDITNYVMLEFGQPLHAFDLETLQGKRIIVRRARPGESITSLDGMKRELSASMLAICDANRPVAVAGVMGGLDTEVTEKTTSLLLESANFDFTNLRQSAAALKMRTEASIRFEKGLNPELPPYALHRAMALVVELAGGQAATGILDAYPGKKEARPVVVTLEGIKRVLGVEMDQSKVRSVLTSLGFDCRPGAHTGELAVSVPYWRSDIRLTADIAEEVARITGYDQIPTTLLHGELPQRLPEPVLDFREKVRDIMSSCGLEEVIAYSLVSQEKLSQTGSPSPALRVANPLSPEQEYLRTTLRPGLLSILGYNQRYDDRAMCVFEVGRVYLPRQTDLPDERETLGVIACGGQPALSWLKEQPLFTAKAGFFDIKGIAEALLCRLGLAVTFEMANDPFFHPAHQAELSVGSSVVGKLGEVHPRIADTFSIHGPAFYLEIDIHALAPLAIGYRVFQPIARFPAVLRDMALVLDAAVTAESVERIIKAERMVTQVALFDVYSGAPIPPGKKSLAYRLVYQSPDRTLTDEEVDKAQDRILGRLQTELGAGLRT
ncbi:MAG: phenylalanine--tRNA ligase subunit beta [Chloroflexi bacterium]|nr:phenylalanine--tRNA ligase subunit beta [Chloroflexota bacterium]